jgi:hypothetical protein
MRISEDDERELWRFEAARLRHFKAVTAAFATHGRGLCAEAALNDVEAIAPAIAFISNTPGLGLRLQVCLPGERGIEVWFSSEGPVISLVDGMDGFGPGPARLNCEDVRLRDRLGDLGPREP